MTTLNRSTKAKTLGSNFAYAVALACGAAMIAGAVASPAYAQRDKKKGKQDRPDYSEAFLAAYTPVNDMTKGLEVNVAGATAGIPAVVAAISTPDDRMAAGGLIFNIGLAAEDLTIQRQGYDLMIESGKVPEAEAGKYYYNAGSLAFQDNDYEVARTRFMEAVARGYVIKDLENTISGMYFAEDRYEDGLSYLSGVIDTMVANGEKPPEALLIRGFSAAYNNDLQKAALDWTVKHVTHYPTDANWINVIALRREYFDEDNKIVLDLLRLQDRTAGLKNDRDYINYIEVSNVRFPAEMERIVNEGIKSGVLDASGVMVQEARSGLAGRVKGVRQDVAELEAEARAAGADAVDATIAGDVYLSLGQPAKAEEMFLLALGRPELDADLVYTHLGIAQADLGKGAEAQASFAKVTGAFKPVAEIWAVYASQLPSAEPAMAAEAAAESAM